MRLAACTRVGGPRGARQTRSVLPLPTEIEGVSYPMRALIAANDWMRSVELQHLRLHDVNAELWQTNADFDFYVTALKRLERAVVFAETYVVNGNELEPALATFRTALPHLTKVRDIMEHFDDYQAGRGRHFESPVLVTSFGYATVAGPDGPERRGVVLSVQPSVSSAVRFELGTDIATDAARALHGATISFLADKLSGPTELVETVVTGSLAITRGGPLAPILVNQQSWRIGGPADGGDPAGGAR